MTYDQKEAVQRIEEIIVAGGSPYDIEPYIEVIKRHEASQPLLEELFRIFERNPSGDFGNPGPLVHFLESFQKRGFEEQLLRSLDRTPSPEVVWMLSALINGSTGEEREGYFSVLHRISRDEGTPQDAKAVTIEILDDLK